VLNGEAIGPSNEGGCEFELPQTLSAATIGIRFGIEPVEQIAKRREHTLDLQKILSDLTAEKDRIAKAIDALLELPSKRGSKKGVKRQRPMRRRRGGITLEAEDGYRLQ
jgi:hypothetical protein